jgi:hypothetical protein
MRVAAIVFGALAIAALGILRHFARRSENKSPSIDVGSVSESWLAEQRGQKTD